MEWQWGVHSNSPLLLELEKQMTWAEIGSIVLLLTGIVTMVWKLAENKLQILAKMAEDKESLDHELLAIRMAAFEEYKILRRENNDAADGARRDFGESLHAIREKMTQIEIWIRDELSKTRHTLTGSMDMRHHMVDEKLEAIDARLRIVEIRLGPINQTL